MTSPFVTGDRVDITIRGARFERQGDHEVDVYLAGLEEPIRVRTVDDDGEPLDDVIVDHHVPTVQRSDVWQARYGGTLFFGVQADGCPVQLATGDNRAYDPKVVVEHWGPIDLIASAAEHRAGPDPEAIRLSAVDVRVGDQVFHGHNWHRVLGAEQPANEGDDHVRLYTHYTMVRGLLFHVGDDLWVLRSEDTPVFAEVDSRRAEEQDPWSGFLRPDDEPQPGDNAITTSLEEVPAPLALEPPAASEAATQFLPKVTDDEPVR